MLIKTQTGDLINLAHVIAISCTCVRHSSKDTPVYEVYAQTVNDDEHTLKKIHYEAEFTHDEYGYIELDDFEVARQEQEADALIEDIFKAYERGEKVFCVSKP